MTLSAIPGILLLMPPESLLEAPDIGPAPDLNDPKSVTSWVAHWLERSKHMDKPLFTNLVTWVADGHGYLTVQGDVNFAGLNETSYKQFKRRIPLNFDKVLGSFFVTADWVETFEGFPRTVQGTMNLSGSSISSWEGAPRYAEHITLNELLLTSLDIENAQKVHVETLNLGFINEPICVPTFMFFNGLQHITCQGAVADHVIDVVLDYANHLLRTCKEPPRKKALYLQQQLIDNGFEEWAEL